MNELKTEELELLNKLDLAFNFDNCILKEMDILGRDWNGTLLLKTPLGRKEIKWITKAKDEAIKHNSTIVCLIPARPDTKVWQNIIFKNANHICFTKNNYCNNKDFPSALVIFGEVNNKQKEILDNLGMTFKVA